MIISASRRTDIPAYYSRWFMNRLKDGHVLVRNPFNNAQLSRIPLTPDTVDCIVFWTKDCENLYPYIDEIEDIGHNVFFQFTLTPYGKELETNLRNKEDIESSFIKLSQKIGREKINWRYDPIILNDSLDINFHKREFLRLCRKLSPYCGSLTISFVDLYPKLKSKLIREIRQDEINELSEFIGSVSRDFGLTVKACCENYDLSPFGIQKGSCIDRDVLEEICGCRLKLKPDKNQRPGCGCAESIDIGAYNTCLNGCIYCYANNSPATALRRNLNHNPLSGLLVGEILPGEIIKDRKI